MSRSSAGFYHDPPLWVGHSPVDWPNGAMVDFSGFDQEVVSKVMNCGISVRITCEGLFAFDFERWPKGLYPREKDGQLAKFDVSADVLLRRTLVMNAFLAFMYTAVINSIHFEVGRMVVTPELVIAMGGLGSDSGMGFGNQRVSHLALSRFESTYRAGLPPIMDDRIQTRGHPVPSATAEQALTSLDNLIASHGEDGLLLADLFLRASKAYQEHNHSLSLITSWTITEKLLARMWTSYQAANTTRDGKPFIDGPRRKRLQDGRTFTAAVIIETLSLVGELDLNIYSNLGFVRKARNDWMHNLKAPDAAAASTAALVAQTMLSKVMNLELIGASSLKIHG